MTENEIIIKSKESIIKAIRDGFEPMVIEFRLGYPGGIIRGFPIPEICTKEEITQMKELIIAGIQRQIDNLKKTQNK